MTQTNWQEEHLRTTVCHFTKHRGEGWWDVVQTDRAYVEWLLKNIEWDDDEESEELVEALTWGVTHAPDRF